MTEALHACASGILTAEAAVSLLSGCGSWLHRDDFTSSSSRRRATPTTAPS